MPNVHNMRDIYLIAVVICMRFSVSIISSREDNFVKPSKLTISNTQTKPKCRISLYPRPYLTVPYLGRGIQKPVLESKLQQGMGLEPKKSCKTITEKTN
mgnify:CR=1 FL=1